MALPIPKRSYTGAIRSVTLGKGGKSFQVGGETAFPFYSFEGKNPNAPRFGLEIQDIPPTDWAEPLQAIYGSAASAPGTWAKKCVEEFGADLIQLTLAGTNPNDRNLPADTAVKAALEVANAVEVPLSIWGSGSPAKDAEVLRAVAEALPARRLALGPVAEANLKQLGAVSMAYRHVVIASSPIDINLAKQLNVLLGNLGVSSEDILIDPTVGGLGYGMEYTYSVMERVRAAALTQQDDKLQYPLYCNLGVEIWKTKEAKTPEVAPALGDSQKRGMLMELVAASALLAAGGDILIMRHPEAMKLARNLVRELTPG